MSHSKHSTISEGERSTHTSQSNESRNYDDQLNITVRTVDSDSYSCTIAHSETVLELKERLENVAGVTRERQRLIFRGRVMKDEKTLRECGLQTGNVIHLVIRPLGAIRANNNTLELSRLSSTRHTSILPPSGFMVSTFSLESEGAPISDTFSSLFRGSRSIQRRSLPTNYIHTPNAMYPSHHEDGQLNNMPTETRSIPLNSQPVRHSMPNNNTLLNRASTHLRRIQNLWSLAPEYEIEGNDMIRTGRIIWELSNTLEHLIGIVRPLARTLINENTVLDLQERVQIQEETSTVAREMYRLTQLENTLTTILHRTIIAPTLADGVENSATSTSPHITRALSSGIIASPNLSPANAASQRSQSIYTSFSPPGMPLSMYPDIPFQFEAGLRSTFPISLATTRAIRQLRENNQGGPTNHITRMQVSQQQPFNLESSNTQVSNPLASVLSSLFRGASTNTISAPLTTTLPSESTEDSNSFVARPTIPFVSIIPSSGIGPSLRSRDTINTEISTNPYRSFTRSIPNSRVSSSDTTHPYNLGVFGTSICNYLTLLEESESRINVSVAEILRLEPNCIRDGQDFVYHFFRSIYVHEAREIIEGNSTSLKQIHSRLSGFFQSTISCNNQRANIIDLADSISDYLINQLGLKKALPIEVVVVESLQNWLKHYLTKQVEELLQFLFDVKHKRQTNNCSPTTPTDFIPNWVRNVVQEVRNNFFTTYGHEHTREIVHLVVKHHLPSLTSLLALSASRFSNELEYALLSSEITPTSETLRYRWDNEQQQSTGESSGASSNKRRKLSDS
ncbi:hypothetical protein K7432_006801 [Basidiobolus ranarum]|uniref:Ubiquitin-like domain-containing protein n=1 Tax=Basidiobolus ranarum TaxID=34480 RepID=A0ABR2W120_9FUNG